MTSEFDYVDFVPAKHREFTRKIANVMLAYMSGSEIQSCAKPLDEGEEQHLEWVDDDRPVWDWNNFIYRVKVNHD